MLVDRLDVEYYKTTYEYFSSLQFAMSPPSPADSSGDSDPKDPTPRPQLDRETTQPPRNNKLERRRSTRWVAPDGDETHVMEGVPAALRGIAAATRKLLLPVRKVVMAKGGATAKTAVRAVGENRPLAFASEGAVAGESMIPRLVYYGAWTLSGAAIAADIYNKYDDAPKDKKWPTVYYWTAFHVPASLVVPAMIIHQIVHQVQHAVEHREFARAWSPRAKLGAPVAAALISIIPVVPVVDTTFEYMMEPTLGSYLGLEFEHYHHDTEEESKKSR